MLSLQMILWSQAFTILWMNMLLCRRLKKIASLFFQAKDRSVTTIIGECFNTKGRKLHSQNKRIASTSRSVLIFHTIFSLRCGSVIRGQASLGSSVGAEVWSSWASGYSREIFTDKVCWVAVPEYEGQRYNSWVESEGGNSGSPGGRC